MNYFTANPEPSDLPNLMSPASGRPDGSPSARMQPEDRWGTGPAKQPYTPADYAALEEYYTALTATRPRRSLQAELAIRKVCRLNLECMRQLDAGNYTGAKALQEMIKTEMENEQLRKKDEPAAAPARLDDIVRAVEQAGLPMSDYDQLVRILASAAFHPPYPYTRDAADEMLLLIRNATAWNEDRPVIPALPPDLHLKDHPDEFARRADAEEQQLRQQLGLPPAPEPA